MRAVALLPILGLAAVAVAVRWSAEVPGVAPKGAGVFGAADCVPEPERAGDHEPATGTGMVRVASGASVSGCVRSDDGLPFAGAEVLAPGGQTAVTDTAGRYTLRGLGEGLVRLRAAAPGFVARPLPPLRLRAEETVDGFDLVLTRSYALTGRVHDAAGYAVAGVEVRAILEAVERADGTLRPVATEEPLVVRTDADGGFAFCPLPRGMALVEVQGARWQPFARRFRVDGASCTIPLAAATMLAGEVVDGTLGTPASIQDVLVVSGAHLAARHVPEPADATAGRFAVPVIPGREVSLLVRTRSGIARSIALRVSPGQTPGPLRLVTEAPANLHLRVVDRDGRPVAAARVAVRQPGLHGELAVAHGDATGIVCVDALARGRYEVRVEAAGCRPAMRAIELPADEPPVLVLERGWHLCGRLEAADHAVAVADRVVVQAAGGAQEVARARLVDGGFRCDFVPVGEVAISLAAGDMPMSGATAAVRLDRGTASPLRIDALALGLAALHGRLRLAGREVGDVQVELRVAGRVVAQTILDGRGTFGFVAVPPGTWTVRFVPREGGVPLLQRDIVLTAGERARLDAEVELGGVRGLGPASGRWELRGAEVSCAAAYDARSGSFRWPCVPVGPWTVAWRRTATESWQESLVQVQAGREVDVVPPAGW